MKVLNKVKDWAKGVYLAIIGKQIIPTDRKDWSVKYGLGGRDE